MYLKDAVRGIISPDIAALTQKLRTAPKLSDKTGWQVIVFEVKGSCRPKSAPSVHLCASAGPNLLRLCICVRNSLVKDFSSIDKRKDAGFLKESFIALNLIRQLKANMELRFWRTKQGHEVDFIVVKNRVPYPIEVKSGMRKPEVPNGMKKFLNVYDDAPMAIVFNDQLTDEVDYQGRIVHFQHWMTSEDIDFMRKAM